MLEALFAAAAEAVFSYIFDTLEPAERLHQLEAEATDPEQKALLHIEWGDDFGSPHETALTQQFDRPVFVVGYPTAVKAFYMEPWPGRPEVCKSADLLAPEGYGEIIGGFERMSDPDLWIQRIREAVVSGAVKSSTSRF